MCPYYLKHMTCTRLKEVINPRASYVWNGYDNMCIVAFLMYFGSFLVWSSQGDLVQDLELMVRICRG